MQAPVLLRICFLLFVAVSASCTSNNNASNNPSWFRWPAPAGDVPEPAIISVTPTSSRYHSDLGRLVLSGARREILAIELRVQVERGAVHALSAIPTQLTGPGGVIPVSNVRLYRLYATETPPLPGWHVRFIDPTLRHSRPLDAAIPIDAPLGGLPAGMQEGQWLALLLEIEVPSDSPQGVYSGVLRLSDDGRPLHEVPIELSVLPFELPLIGKPRFLASIDLNQLTGLNKPSDHHQPGSDSSTPHASPLLLLANTSTLLQRHGVTPHATGITPDIHMRANGEPTANWTLWDAAHATVNHAARSVNPLAHCPIQIPFDNTISALADAWTPNPTTQDRPYFERYLQMFATHLRQRQVRDRTFVELPSARSTNESLAFVARVGTVVKQLEIPVRSSFHLHAPPADTTQILHESGADAIIDIRCPPAQFCDTHDKKVTWFSLDRPPFSGTFSLNAPDTHTRVIPLQALRYRIDTVDLGDATRWPANLPAPLTPQQCSDFDASTFIYPGTVFGLETPVATMRLKRFREGVQDIRYMSLLKQSGLDHVAERLSEGLSPYALADVYRNHVDDPLGPGWLQVEDAWDIARDIMIHELMLARSDDTDTANRRLKVAILWRRFIDMTGGLSMFVEGVRVRHPNQAGMLSVECLVRIENKTQSHVGGRLQFAPLPVGWKRERRDVQLSPIAHGAPAHMTLVAQTDAIGWNSDGVTELPISLLTDDGHEFRTVARMSLLTSIPAPQPITLDADLSEWSPASGNLATSFTPLFDPLADHKTAPSPDTNYSSTITPPSGVRCLTTHDRAYVYFGITMPISQIDADTSGSNTITNRLNYHDGIPLGTDTIELLFDPSNAGTHATDDLYHIVMTRHGVVTERGISQGDRERIPWLADIQYTARTIGNQWVAELRLPRDCFGTGVAGPQYWGFNITHFDASSQRYKTWSAARWNPYDPMSLGTLVIP